MRGSVGSTQGKSNTFLDLPAFGDRYRGEEAGKECGVLDGVPSRRKRSHAPTVERGLGLESEFVYTLGKMLLRADGL